jgi:hypothetical protein
MKNFKLLIGAVVAFALLAIGGISLYAQRPISAPHQASDPPTQLQGNSSAATTPTIGTPVVTPALIATNSNILVTITIQITNPSVISNSVNLLQLGLPGAQSVTLGQLHDDGKNGDAVAGDSTYTIQRPFEAISSGQFQLEISAAFTGVLKRVQSLPFVLAIGTPYSYTPGGLSVIDPPGWTVNPPSVLTDVTMLSFAPPNDPHPEYGGDVTIFIWQNPDNLPPQQFFDGTTTHASDLYDNAAGGIESVTIGTNTGIKFAQVVGEATEDVYVFQRPGQFIEFDIAGNSYLALAMLGTLAF